MIFDNSSCSIESGLDLPFAMNHSHLPRHEGDNDYQRTQYSGHAACTPLKFCCWRYVPSLYLPSTNLVRMLKPPLDCLRDIGLDKECYRVATHEAEISQVRWCHSILGEEYGRLIGWGYDPKRTGEYRSASPSIPVSVRMPDPTSKPKILCRLIFRRHC